MEIDEAVREILNVAFQEARSRRHEYFTPEHVLYAALTFEASRELIASTGGTVGMIVAELEHYFNTYIPTTTEEPLPIKSLGFQRILRRAIRRVVTFHKSQVEIGDILVSIFEDTKAHGSFFMRKAGVTLLSLNEAVSCMSSFTREKEEEEEIPSSFEGNQEKPGTPSEMVLQKYATDLTQLAEEGKLEPLVGRQDILERTIEVLCRRLKNNPIHIGDPGVGKTAITEGLAQRISEGKVPSLLKDFRIYSLDMAGLLAGTRFRGDFEERMKRFLEVLSEQERSILFIDEIHGIIGAGGSIDISFLLKPALARGALRCIGSTTHEEFVKHIEKDHALARRFQRVEIPETSGEETYEILKQLQERYEKHHGVLYSDDGLKAAVDLSDQFLLERRLPDKALDLLDEAGSRKRLLLASDEPVSIPPVIERGDIEEILSRMTSLPKDRLSLGEAKSLQTLSDRIKGQLFGQDGVVDAVVDAIKQARAGLSSPGKPMGSFLFVGPTGVGKTELAQLLAKELGVGLHRFDMSEYQEKHTVSRLIGSPPGYVGYEEGGALTDIIRRDPHAVLLLDEIEKAHPDIFNVLLQVLDYATLTDNAGRKADFRSSVIIMTSNAGASRVGKELLGFDSLVITDDVIEEAIEEIFSPEFRNRLDRVLYFRGLDMGVMEQIVCKELAQVGRLLKKKGVQLCVSNECVRWLAQKGYAPESGARNVSRFVGKKIKAFFVDQILFGQLASGGSVRVTVTHDEVAFELKKCP